MKENVKNIKNLLTILLLYDIIKKIKKGADKMKKQIKIKQTKSNIIFLILGRAIVYAGLYIGSIAFLVWSFQQITVYR